MIKILLYIIIFVCFCLVTFFGLGPVLMADGGIGERMITLLVVIVLYVLLFFILRAVRRFRS